jgi:hypothetical protein
MGVILQEAFPNMAASAISRGDLLDNFQFVPYQVQGQTQELGTINVELAEKFVFGNVEVWYYILEETIQTVQDTMSGLPWPGWTPACSSSVWIRRIGH